MSIDTSITAGKIQVMQDFNVNGKKVQRRPHDEERWSNVIVPSWNWGTCDFRLIPQTVEEAAIEHSLDRTTAPLSSNPTKRESFKAGVKWRDENQKD